jgi:cytidine deaminase
MDLLNKRLSPQRSAGAGRSYDWYARAQDAGNYFCKEVARADAMARLAVQSIASLRDTDGPQAFVISSLKRPEEVDLLREVYGRGFVLVAVHDTYEAMVKNLAERLAKSEHRRRTEEDGLRAAQLIVKDAAETDNKFGQNVAKTYPLADAFVNASYPAIAERETERLVSLMFKPCFRSPSRDEHAMMHAYAAGLRSADLSRQVGAAISSQQGEVLATGTNDVPAAGGGIAWEGDVHDARDFQLRLDISKERRLRTARELATILRDPASSPVEMNDQDLERLLSKSQVLALGEFGRTVHAEMDAILSAARIGIPIRGTYIYTTTFPCHNCVRHIIGAGITRVVYMIPYEKSLAFELHDDAIVREGYDPTPNKVVLKRFVGVAPRRYADYFAVSKDERKEAEIPTLKDHFRVDITQYTELEKKVVAVVPAASESSRKLPSVPPPKAA